MGKTKKSRPHVATDAVDDPFERLPEHIHHHIISLLRSNNEAARTAAVSRSWHRAWSSYPIFDFVFSDFGRKGAVNSPDERHKRNDQFLDFVDKAMSRLHEQRVAIPRLTVGTTLIEMNRSRALFDKWIGMAVDSGAKELRLFFLTSNQDYSYLVPARVFSSGSIRTMTFIGEGLITPLDSICTVNLSSLQSLRLKFVKLDEPMLQKLLRGCPLLEELELISCKPLTQVIISGPNNLRTISVLGHVNRVEIEAPSLEELHCYNTGYSRLLNQVVLDRCPRVKLLELDNSAISQHRLQKLLSKLPLLESLTIKSCNRLKKIMIPNPLLKKMEIGDCKGLVDIEIGFANVSYFRYRTMEMQLPFIRMLNPTALSVCEANFESESVSLPEPDWFIRLREFLIRSCQFRYLSFDMFAQEEGNVQDTCDPLPLLPYNVERLKLCVRTPRSCHAAILNRLLSLCHPTSLQVKPDRYGCDFVKFVCEKLESRGDNDDVSCCCSGSGHCWLHQLKGVEIERIGFSDHKGPLDWRTLHELLPNLHILNHVYFKLYWE